MHSLSVPSPLGRLTIVSDDAAVVAINWADETVPQDRPTPLLAEAARQLGAYFAGALTRFDLPVRPAGSPFEQRVWAAMCAIPHGQTRRYGELASAIGSAPRAVGGACGRNPIPLVVPCHRVLRSGGALGGYGGGLPMKQALLELEGAL